MNPYVSAEPARAHVKRLMKSGMTLERIADQAGICRMTLWYLLNDRERPIRQVTSERLLTVHLKLAQRALLDPTDTARRIQALVASGWTLERLRAPLGFSRVAFIDLSHGRRPVRLETAKAVYDLYVELIRQEPPRRTRWDIMSIGYAHKRAERFGWTRPVTHRGRPWIGPAPEQAAQLDLGDREETAS